MRVMSVDEPEVTHALAEAARYWITAEDVRPTFLFESCRPPSLAGLSSRGWDRRIVYNNFYVTRLAFWNRTDVRAWHAFVERTHGIFKYRWGDAPVHTLTLGMFAARDAVVEFDFAYSHVRGVWREGFASSAFNKVPAGRVGRLDSLKIF
jgi:mannosyltransferase